MRLLVPSAGIAWSACLPRQLHHRKRQRCGCGNRDRAEILRPCDEWGHRCDRACRSERDGQRLRQVPDPWSCGTCTFIFGKSGRCSGCMWPTGCSEFATWAAISPVRSAWRREVEAGRSIGPRIYTPGSPIDGPSRNLLPKMSVIVGHRCGAGRADRWTTLDRQGVDFIKVLSTLVARRVPLASATSASDSRHLRRSCAGRCDGVPGAGCSAEEHGASVRDRAGVFYRRSRNLREARLLAIQSNDAAGTGEDPHSHLRDVQTKHRAIELFQRMARFDAWQTPTLDLAKALVVDRSGAIGA